MNTTQKKTLMKTIAGLVLLVTAEGAGAAPPARPLRSLPSHDGHKLQVFVLGLGRDGDKEAVEVDPEATVRDLRVAAGVAYKDQMLKFQDKELVNGQLLADLGIGMEAVVENVPVTLVSAVKVPEVMESGAVLKAVGAEKGAKWWLNEVLMENMEIKFFVEYHRNFGRDRLREFEEDEFLKINGHDVNGEDKRKIFGEHVEYFEDPAKAIYEIEPPDEEYDQEQPELCTISMRE